MATRAGRLRRRVTLQQPGTAADSTGQVVGYTTVTTVSAAVEPARGRQMLGSSSGAEKIVKEVTALIIMRWRPDIDATWRIVHETPAGEEIYGIISIESPQSRQAMLELLCRRVDTGEPA